MGLRLNEHRSLVLNGYPGEQNLWQFLPKSLRLPGWLWWLNLVSALVFLLLGIKGYWDDTSRWYAIGSLFGMLVLGILGGYLARNWIAPADEEGARESG